MITAIRQALINTATKTGLWLVSFPSFGKVRLFCSVRQLCYNFSYLISQLGEEDHERSSKTSSYKDYNQDDAEVRAVGPQMVFNNPNQPCYTQFFVGVVGAPPIGLRAGQVNLRYICQTYHHQTYYATMFDEQRGIAVFSAYTLTQANVNFHPNRRAWWRRTHANGNYSL